MRKRILVVGLLSGAIGACAALDYTRLYYNGPVSSHFDGARFFNPARPIGKGLLDVITWRMRSDRAQWPESVPLAAGAKPPERVMGGELRVTFVGHATVLIQTAGINILTDPTWSERAFMVQWAGPRRVTPPGIAFEDLPPIDIVLVSHNHYDHMDLPTIARLRAHDPLVVAPLGNDRALLSAKSDLRVYTLDWWQSLDFNDRVKVHLVPVYHWSRREPFDRNKALWGGYVVQTPGGNIYIAGDTGFGDGAFFAEAQRRFRHFRLAVLPLGAYEPRWFMKDQHINPAEAVQIHRLLGAQFTLGAHLRTFQLSDEAIDQPEKDLAVALREAGVSPQHFFTLPVGGIWTDSGIDKGQP